MNVAHVTLSPVRFECKRCGTVHAFMTSLWGDDYARKGEAFMMQHAQCAGRRHQPPMEFRPAMPPAKSNIIC